MLYDGISKYIAYTCICIHSMYNTIHTHMMTIMVILIFSVCVSFYVVQIHEYEHFCRGLRDCKQCTQLSEIPYCTESSKLSSLLFSFSFSHNSVPIFLFVIPRAVPFTRIFGFTFQLPKKEEKGRKEEESFCFFTNFPFF